MSGRPSREAVTMLMAVLASWRSTCERRKVGAVITNFAGTEMVVGYNGGYAGGPNKCEGDPSKSGACGCIHAEANALAKRRMWEPPSIAYITTAPCLVCATMLVNAAVVHVCYRDEYRNKAGLDLLERAGVTIEHVEVDLPMPDWEG